MWALTHALAGLQAEGFRAGNAADPAESISTLFRILFYESILFPQYGCIYICVEPNFAQIELRLGHKVPTKRIVGQ